MAKKETYLQQKVYQNEFLMKYGNIIDHLSKMPKDSVDEQTVRYNWFINTIDDECIPLLYKSIKLLSAKRMNMELDSLKSKQTNKPESPEMAEKRRKIEEKDAKLPEFFYQSLTEVVKNYTGYSKAGNTVSFFQAIGQKIQNKFYSFYINEQSKKIGVGAVTTRKILKLAKLGKERMLIEHGEMSREKLLEFLRIVNSENEKLRLSDGSVKSAVNIATGFDPKTLFPDDALKLNEKLNQEDNRKKLEAERILFPKLITLLFGVESEIILEELKKNIFDGSYRSTWEWILWFLQVETLVQLKLSQDPEEEKLSDIPEKVPLQAYRKLNHYRYITKPAGDEMIYNELKDASKQIFQQLMHDTYLDLAFDKLIIDNLEDMFNELLRDDFDFSDEIQMRARAGKGTLRNYQKKRREYDNKWKEALFKFYLE